MGEPSDDGRASDRAVHLEGRGQLLRVLLGAGGFLCALGLYYIRPLHALVLGEFALVAALVGWIHPRLRRYAALSALTGYAGAAVLYFLLAMASGA
jgi:hypothetical protein